MSDPQPLARTASVVAATPAPAAASEGREADALCFDFHGVGVAVEVDDPACRDRVARDFSCMRVPDLGGDAAIRLRVRRGEPSAAHESGRPWIRTRDARVYRSEGRRVLASPREPGTGPRAQVRFDFRGERCDVESDDLELLHEKTTLAILSRVGLHLDRRGLHRIHAMGVAHRGRAVLCLMPMGGGKTTLTLGLLGEPDFALLSDEAPLVDRAGNLHALPMRLGVRSESEAGVPAEYRTRIERVRHGPKTLIDARRFADRIAPQAAPGLLLVGRRGRGAEPRLAPIGRRAAAAALWQMSVRAQGLPQLLEHVVRPTPASAAEQLRIHAARARACTALLRRSRCYAVVLSEDRAANAARVAELARELAPGAGAGPA